jgi:hypothetical protein
VEDLPPGLAAVVATALRKHPDNRFATMDAMARALGSVTGAAGPAFEAPPLRRARIATSPGASTPPKALRALRESIAA